MQMVACINGIFMYRLIQGVPTVCSWALYAHKVVVSGVCGLCYTCRWRPLTSIICVWIFVCVYVCTCMVCITTVCALLHMLGLQTAVGYGL